MVHLRDALYLFILLFVSPWIAWRRWYHGRYRQGWSEKLFGLSPQRSQTQLSTRLSHTIWLHAVSVGEVQVLRTLVEMLEKHRPDLILAISVSTDSGIELARKLFSRHQVFYAPLDFSWAIRRTLNSLRPSLIVLTELELWPNWLLTAEKQNIPVVVFNGRLSESSFRGYSRVRFLVEPCMRSLDWVGAQSQAYADRFRKLGVSDARLVTTGNVKFDGATGDRQHPEIQTRRQLLNILDTDLLWLAGSTQAPEEDIVLEAFQTLTKLHPNLKLILVPRHPERFDEVAKKVEQSQLPWERRSQCTLRPARADWKIFLADSVGELRWWWGLADLGFVGGSFGDRGGQNMIEPCAYGVATCFGPNTKNFADIVRLLIEDAACAQLQSPSELEHWIDSMVKQPQARLEMAERAAAACRKHRGASQRTWDGIAALLAPPPNA